MSQLSCQLSIQFSTFLMVAPIHSQSLTQTFIWNLNGSKFLRLHNLDVPKTLLIVLAMSVGSGLSPYVSEKLN